MSKISFTNTMSGGFKSYEMKSGIGAPTSMGADKKAKVAMALQLLNWTINGSGRVNVTPPIKDGILRGSGSAFVCGELIGDTKTNYPSGMPNTSYSNQDPEEIVVGFNTAYAARMHETNWTPGPASVQAGDVGNKFLEKHMNADGKDLLALYAAIVRKEMR